MWEDSGVNLRLSISLLLLATGLARAQQQERTLEQRIMKPDMTMDANEQKKGFRSEKSFGTTNANGDKHFSLFPQFSLKSFFTSSYSDSKSYWTGDYKPGSKGSTLAKNGNFQDAGKRYDTKTMAVSEAREAGKSYNKSSNFATKETREVGKSQKALDQQHAQKEMSIDEVRDLLNKSK